MHLYALVGDRVLIINAKGSFFRSANITLSLNNFRS